MSVLKQVKLLSDLSESELKNLSMFCQDKTLSEGETLFHEGDEANAMYILAEGEIEISNLIDGERVKLGSVNAEEILGEMALFGKTSRRMATAIATKKSKLLVVLSFSIKELTSKHSELLDRIKLIIEERTVNNKIIESEIKG
ncbi:cyclic nucleotide-binding domain-containing protein [Candidatus Gracilibacteria bacterium]|nr:cyclic nucleotide-binding domain-containing protein [Candidatus Gracilibacteria bacterium]